MSERRLILLIVLILFAGAWFFGYDNGSNSSAPNAAPFIDINSPRPPPGSLATPAAPALTAIPDAPTATASPDPAIPRGFPENHRLAGTWSLAPDAPLSATTAPSTDPPSITFHPDGAFSEHRLLSTDGLPLRPDLRRPDLSGRYTLRGFTLSIVRDDPDSFLDPGSQRPLEYTISPLAADTDIGMPPRLYIDGKVLQYKR